MSVEACDAQLVCLMKSLEREFDFDEGASPELLRRLAYAYSESTFPIRLLLAWLDVCPEARKNLVRRAEPNTPATPPVMNQVPSGREHMVYEPPPMQRPVRVAESPQGAVFAEENTAPLLPSTLAQGTMRPKQFRARLGDRMALVELMKVDPGGAIIVKEVGVASYGQITVLDRSCVAEEHLAQVNAWIAELIPKNMKWEDGTPAKPVP